MPELGKTAYLAWVKARKARDKITTYWYEDWDRLDPSEKEVWAEVELKVFAARNIFL